jgi:tetratricopeptide (TPR) repeat protein
MGQYKRPEAAQALGEALEIRRRLLGHEHEDTAASLSDLAAVYGEEGKVAEAESMAREALRIKQRFGGSNNLEVANSLRTLCMIQGKAKRWSEAEESARKVLDIRRNLLGPEHPSVAAALHDLAWAVNATKKYEEALREKLGDDDAARVRSGLRGDDERVVAARLRLGGRRSDGDAVAEHYDRGQSDRAPSECYDLHRPALHQA